MIVAKRYHDISCGHRVYGHEGKCRHFHGHNYRVHFHVTGNMDSVGRVLDFGVIKSKLCIWLEENWDHKMLLWKNDPLLAELQALDPDGVVALSFNPTAENMAQWLLNVAGPSLLANTNCLLTKVEIEETRKCSVGVEL